MASFALSGDLWLGIRIHRRHRLTKLKDNFINGRPKLIALGLNLGLGHLDLIRLCLGPRHLAGSPASDD